MDHTVLNLLEEILPVIIITVLLAVILKKSLSSKQTDQMRIVKEYYDAHLAETRKMNASLERVALVLEQRKG